jgi:hypothetical protein
MTKTAAPVLTLAALVAQYNELATAAGKPTRKSFDSKALAQAAIKSLTPKKARKTGAEIKVRAARTPAAPHAAGPRGFKFGPVWVKSIVEGKGVALKVANLPKLLDTAKAKGVEVTEDLTQAEIAAAVAKAFA